MAARIRAAAGREVDLDILGLFPWDFGAAVADRQREGRVFLVGDAAHRTTPRGATGMNTGIADGHNLGWKLGWVLRGWADEDLLDSYEQERAAVGRANAEASLVTSVGAPPSNALAHDFAVRYDSSVITGSGPLAGRRAPHAWISEELSTVDLFDGHLTLLAGSEGGRWREQGAGLAFGGVPIVALCLGTDVLDVDGAVATAYGLEPGGCVLIRPDGYVAWATQDGEGADEIDLRSAVFAALGHRVRALVPTC